MNRRNFFGWCAGAVACAATGLTVKAAVTPKLVELKWKRVWVWDRTIPYPRYPQPCLANTPYFGGIVFTWFSEPWVETTYDKIKKGDVFEPEGEETKQDRMVNGPYIATSDAYKMNDGVNWWWTCNTAEVNSDITVDLKYQDITPNEVRAMRGK